MKRQHANRYWLGRRPGHQGPRPISDYQDMVGEKLATGVPLKSEIPRLDSGLMATGNRFQTRKGVKIGTWNVRGLLQEGSLELLESELERHHIQVCGLSETWWTNKGHFTTDNGHTVVFSGNADTHRQGVAVWLHRDIAKSLISYEPVNSRLMSITLQAAPNNITLIQVYAPTAVDENEEREKFYEELQQVISKTSKRSALFLIGDCNAKIGEGPSHLPTTGEYGLGDRNEAGEDLYNFCLHNDLSIANTMFKHHKRHRYTWTSPDGRTRNQIDYIMVHKRLRTSIKNCRAYPGADCNSDHNLVVALFKCKITKPRVSCPTIRLDLDSLSGPKGIQYATEVRNRFEALQVSSEEVSPNELWTKGKDAMLSAAKATVRLRQKPKKSDWMSATTLQKVEEKRKAKSLNRQLYADLKRDVQRLVRKDKQDHMERLCEQLEEEARRGNSRSMFKHMQMLTSERRIKLNGIQSSEGINITDPKAIARRWKEYTEELYKDGNSSHSERLTQCEREPPPLRSEVQKAMHGVKLRKAAGADEVPIELLLYGGDQALDFMHTICKEVWKTGEWPDDWGFSTFIPIPKKGDHSKCTNYRTISLVSHASKILLKIILDRIRGRTENELSDEQAGFRPGRGTRDQVTNLRVLMAKLKDHNQPLYMCFIDFQKAFDSVQHEKLWWAMLDMGYPPHLVNLLASLYKSQKACVRVAGVISEWFSVQKGVRQGCVLSPYLFNILSETVMRKALENYSGGVLIGGRRITNLRYADDIVLLAASVEELQELVNKIASVGKEYNLLMNTAKTKTMALGGERFQLEIDGEQIEQVSKFSYLGSIITDDSECKHDIKHRLALGSAAMAKLKSLWSSHSLTLNTKVRLCKALVWPTVAYASEGWTLHKDDEKRLNAFEMKMLRRMLRISWQEHRTNESILTDTGYKMGFLSSIKKKKLVYAGHIARATNSLEKTVMQGRVPGKRLRGRPRRSWMDDISSWTGLGAAEIERIALNRHEWRNVVLQSSQTLSTRMA